MRNTASEGRCNFAWKKPKDRNHKINSSRKNTLQTKTTMSTKTKQRLVRLHTPMPRQLTLHRSYQRPTKKNENPRKRQRFQIRQSQRIPPTPKIQKMQRQNPSPTIRIPNQTTKIPIPKTKLVHPKQIILHHFSRFLKRP